MIYLTRVWCPDGKSIRTDNFRSFKFAELTLNINDSEQLKAFYDILDEDNNEKERLRKDILGNNKDNNTEDNSKEIKYFTEVSHVAKYMRNFNYFILHRLSTDY